MRPVVCLTMTLAWLTQPEPALAQCAEGCEVLRTFAMPVGSFGWAISEVGDTNGDGWVELLVGPHRSTPAAGQGEDGHS